MLHRSGLKVEQIQAVVAWLDPALRQSFFVEADDGFRHNRAVGSSTTLRAPPPWLVDEAADLEFDYVFHTCRAAHE